MDLSRFRIILDHQEALAVRGDVIVLHLGDTLVRHIGSLKQHLRGVYLENGLPDPSDQDVSTLTSQTAISEFGTPGPLELKGVQASIQEKEDAQDLKSCEGFPREGSSPSPGTLKSVTYKISKSESRSHDSDVVQFSSSDLSPFFHSRTSRFWAACTDRVA